MNLVTTNLMGGLGNYMFQIAAVYDYANRFNKTPVLFSKKSITVHRNINEYKNNVLSKVNFVDETNFNVRFITYQEPYFHYYEIPFIDGNLILNGYFQSEKYFINNVNMIRDLFEYPEDYVNHIKEKYSEILKNKTCSIHIRRGNYLNLQQFHPVQDIHYFNKSIEKIPNDSYFLIFSDDIKWCKMNFPNDERFIFIENNNDYEDLLLMSLCENNIISNSTFSWWGAYLNKNPNKIVVAPEKWFGFGNSMNDTKDLYCEKWIKL